MSEGVLEKLCEFSFTSSRDSNRLLYQPRKEPIDVVKAGWGDSGDHLRGVLQPVPGIAWVDSLGAVAEVIVDTCAEA
jgi:hypothetical protein